MIKRLIVITKTISKIYYDLIDLESQGEKNTTKFLLLKEELETALEIEKELYEKIKSVEKAINILDYFSKFDLSFEKLLGLIFDNSDEEMVKARITSKLDYFVKVNKFEDEKENFEDFDVDEEKDDDEEYIPEEEFTKLARMQMAIENDIINTILKLLNEYLNDSNYNNILYVLVEFKYLLCFAFPEIEEKKVANNFEIDDKLIITNKFVADILGISVGELQEQKDDYCMDILESSRNTLISFLDKKQEEIPDIHDTDYFIDATIAEIFIRTCLLFANEDILKNFIQQIENDIEEISEKNEGIVPIIHRAIRNYNQDREKPMLLSLRLGD